MLNKINRKDKKIFHKGRNKKAILILNGIVTPLAETNFIFNFFKKKGYTVARPLFHVCEESNCKTRKCGPEEWLAEARSWVAELSSTEEEIYIIGSSFGANLGVSLLVRQGKKIKALVAVEMPALFSLKFRLYRALGISCTTQKCKNDPTVKGDSASIIKKYINKRTKEELPRVKKPILIIQAVKSDILSSDNAKHIFNQVSSRQKEVCYIPIENHNFSLLDNSGKITLLEKIYQFIT